MTELLAQAHSAAPDLIEVGVRWSITLGLFDDEVPSTVTISWNAERGYVFYAGGLLDDSTVCESCGTPVARSTVLDRAAQSGRHDLPPGGAWWELPAECWEEQDPGGDVDVLVVHHSPELCRASRGTHPRAHDARADGVVARSCWPW